MKLNQFAPLKLQDILVKAMLHETVFPHEIYFATLATAELVAVDMPLHAATDCFRSVTKSKTIQLFFLQAVRAIILCLYRTFGNQQILFRQNTRELSWKLTLHDVFLVFACLIIFRTSSPPPPPLPPKKKKEKNGP